MRLGRRRRWRNRRTTTRSDRRRRAGARLRHDTRDGRLDRRARRCRAGCRGFAGRGRGTRHGRRLTRHGRALRLRTHGRRLGARLGRGHGGRLHPGGCRRRLHLRRARSLRLGGRGRGCGPFRAALLAGLAALWLLRAPWPAWVLISGGGGLCDPVSGLSEGLPGLREDEGRQDGPDQQPAFRAHLYSRRFVSTCGYQAAHGLNPR